MWHLLASDRFSGSYFCLWKWIWKCLNCEFETKKQRFSEGSEECLMGFDSMWTFLNKVSNKLWFQCLQTFDIRSKYLLTYSFFVLIFIRFSQTFNRVTFQSCVCRKLRGFLSRNRPSFSVICLLKFCKISTLFM